MDWNIKQIEINTTITNCRRVYLKIYVYNLL